MIPTARNWLIGIAALCLLAPAVAAPPRTLKVSKTVPILAEPAAVWSRIKDFDGLHLWHPAFAGDEIVQGGDNAVGTVRRLTLKDGPSFTEELLAYNPKAYTLRYRIVESPLPIRDYVSTLKVARGRNKGVTLVTWEGSFRRKAAEPGPDETDAAVTRLIRGVYETGLGQLKSLSEVRPKP
jgi:hypothetical protein